MKIFLGGKNRQIDRSTAMGLAGINLLVTPGLGTLMAGRFFVGAAQLALAVAGFVLLMKWFFVLFWAMIEGRSWPPSWEWQMGAILFGIGWLGALWSSVNIVRAAPERTVATPPKLDGSAN